MEALVIRKSVEDATPVVIKEPVLVALSSFTLVSDEDAEVKLVVEALTTEKLFVPVALVKYRAGTVSPPVEEATLKLRLVVEAFVAKKLVEVAEVNTDEEASRVPEKARVLIAER